jgi:hypothetical protein
MASLPKLSDGIALTHFIVAADVEHAARFWRNGRAAAAVGFVDGRARSDRGAEGEAARLDRRAVRRGGARPRAVGGLPRPGAAEPPPFRSLGRRVGRVRHRSGVAARGVAVAAWRRSPWLEGAATAAATLLFVDAWFDVLTASSRNELVIAIVEAAVVELPIAVFCLFLRIPDRGKARVRVPSLPLFHPDRSRGSGSRAGLVLLRWPSGEPAPRARS